MVLTLHHIKNTRSVRPLWLMEELGLDYVLVNEGPHVGALDKQAYREKNPLGKLPCFFDGDHRITESTAIIEYIANVYGGEKLVRKPGDDDYADYLQYLHFGEAGMGIYISMLVAHTVVLPEPLRDPKMAAWAKGEISNCVDYLEGALGDRDYFLGEFSLADISIAYVLFLLKITRNAGIFGDGISAYFKRISARDGWQKMSAIS